ADAAGTTHFLGIFLPQRVIEGSNFAPWREHLFVAVAHWVEKECARPARAPGDHQRGKRRLWPGAGFGEIGAVYAIGGLEPGGQTGLGIVDIELQRQDGSVARAAIGNRDRNCEPLEAARRHYGRVGGLVALIRDHARDIDTEVSLLQRGLPQTEAREDKRRSRDNSRGKASRLRSPRNLVRALAHRLCAVSLKPCHVGLPNFPPPFETPLRSEQRGERAVRNWARVRRIRCGTGVAVET